MFTSTPRRAVLVLLVVALGVLAACSGSASEDNEAATPIEPTTSVDPATPVEPTAPVEPTSPVEPTRPGSGGQNTDDGQTTDPPPSAGPAPVIDTFHTPDNIDCHNGNSQTFTASWTTTNATEVVISIDGAGPFGTYEPDGSTSLPFDCSSSHTFLLTARSADGQEATTSITLDPRNAQPPADGHELDDATNDTAMDDTMPVAP